MGLTNLDMMSAIRNELNINESFIAQQKQFSDYHPSKIVAGDIEPHLKLYQQYVNDFTETSTELDGVDRSDVSSICQFGRLKRDEIYALNAVYLHELFFRNVASQKSQIYTDSLAYIKLSAAYGDFKRWQADFLACALSTRDGWVVTCGHTFLKNYINIIIDDHSVGIPVGCIPVIVVDTHAHSYHASFGNNKSEYVRSIMSELNWDIIDDRFDIVEKMLKTIK